MGSSHRTGIGMRNKGVWINGVILVLCLVPQSISSFSLHGQPMFEELGLMENMREDVRKLENQTLTQNERLSRMENLFEELKRRILRMEGAKNGTQGTTAAMEEVTTQPSPVP